MHVINLARVLSPRQPRPGPLWWRERGQFWQREQSGLDKCERFSAGHLEWSSFPLCQQVEKFLRPYLSLTQVRWCRGKSWLNGGGQVCCPVNACPNTDWDKYCASKYCVTGSDTAPQRRLDFNLQLVLEPKTILSSRKQSSSCCQYFHPFLLLSLIHITHLLPFVLYCFIFLKSSKCYTSVEFWGS